MAMMSPSGGRGSELALIYDELDKSLYYVDLKVGRAQGQLYASQLGHLLGSTRSLTVDPDGFLYYSVNRDGVLFRWNTKSKLTAENHEVLQFQSTPIVKCLLGVQGAVFLVNERPIDDLEVIHTKKILDHYSQTNELLSSN